MPGLDAQFTIETALFEHREAKPHFINDCCFGEDFAEWLRARLTDLEVNDFAIGEAIHEDYGWGFWVRRDKDSFWIALSCFDAGSRVDSAEWGISVSYDAGMNLMRRLFHKPDAVAFNTLRKRVANILKSADGIRLVEQTW